MNTREKSIYRLIIIVLVGVLYYFLYYKNSSYIDIYKERIDLLNGKIDSLHTENSFLEQEVDSLSKTLTFLDKEIKEQDNLLEKLEKETNEKISSIDTLSTSDITKFFTDRYRYNNLRNPSR